MDPAQWKRVDSLLQAANSLPPQELDAYIARECAGDEGLERELRSLLAWQHEAASFMETPAINSTPEISVSLTGQTISHYRIMEKLGAGGMGVVWKARDTRLDRFVALKFLPAAKMSDPERKRRFIHEAKAASALNHPNIITIYEIDQAEPGVPQAADFIAMEFVPGKALNQLIARKRLKLNEAVHYGIQVADALAAAHVAGIVHRDLKPGNLMVSENGLVKVLDFGLAKLAEPAGDRQLTAEASKTGEGMIVGTVSYMAPEQAEGKKVDARTDIFSFGTVLYEMITGRRAFGGDSVVSILSAILRDEPKPAAEITPGVPRELSRIIARCLQKDPKRRYQHAGDLGIDLRQVQDDLADRGSLLREQAPTSRSAGRWRWIAPAATCLVVALAVGWWFERPQAEPPPWKLTRLTSDAGLSNTPALSPDGKLVAYSSDRSLDGEQDLYVKQVAGGQPIRLTSDGAGNTMPDFSPDGSRIVFRSNRDSGGIYEIPVFGGEVRLLARDGRNPKYSPDGSQVSYWVGDTAILPFVPGSGTVWVVPVAGGQPRRVGSNFTAARNPIWSPDGKHLLIIGYTSAKAYENSSLDWWLVATDGSDAVKTGVFDKPVPATDPARVGNLAGPTPGCWSATTNMVVYALSSGDTTNLWEIGVSPRTGKVSGTPRRLTTAAGNERDPSCAPGGALTFTNAETRTDVWLLAFDSDRGTSKGALERITTGPARREGASLADNGRHVVFASTQSGGLANIWQRDLATGKELAVATSPFRQRYPLSNAAGTRIAFSVFEEGEKRVVYVSTPGGTPEKLCEGCLRATDWSRDEKALLVFTGDPYQINLLDLTSHQQTPLVRHPKYHLLYGRFSPDNRWVSFTVRTLPNRVRIAIAPLDGAKPVPESAWVTIAEGEAGDWADWSPDGKTLYFTSRRDGHTCLWGQRIQAISHRTVSEPFAVQHFHGRVSFQPLGSWWRASGGRIAMVLAENTGNIWMMSRSGPR